MLQTKSDFVSNNSLDLHQNSEDQNLSFLGTKPNRNTGALTTQLRDEFGGAEPIPLINQN